MRTIIFINSRSRRGRWQTRQVIARLEKSKRFKLVGAIVVNRKSQLDAQLARLKKRKDYDCIIVGGGDGTIDAVINAAAGKSVVFGFLPMGTGNAFVRSLGLPDYTLTALDMIEECQPRSIPLGKVNDLLFANVSCIGMPQVVAENISNKTKKLLGKTAYVLSGLWQLIFHQPMHCTLKINGETQKFTTHHLMVTNGGYHGPIKVSSTSLVEKERLVLMAFGTGQSRLKYAGSLMWHAVTGKPAPNTLTFSFKSAALTTKPRRRIEIDGEVALRTPAKFMVAKRKIKVLAP